MSRSDLKVPVRTENKENSDTPDTTHFRLALPESPLLRKEDPLFRGDRRAPEDIYKHGFKSRGSDMDLYMHSRLEGNPESGYISTTLSKEVAIEFPKNKPVDSWIYKIETRTKSKDVLKELGPIRADIIYFKERAFALIIKPEEIKGSWKAKFDSSSGVRVLEDEYLPNPNFKPPNYFDHTIWRVGKIVGHTATLVGIGLDGWSMYHQYQLSSEEDDYSHTYREMARITGGWQGAYLGGWAGTKIGVFIFSPILPPYGSAIGGVTGGLVGSFVGYSYGEDVAIKIEEACHIIESLFSPSVPKYLIESDKYIINSTLARTFNTALDWLNMHLKPENSKPESSFNPIVDAVVKDGFLTVEINADVLKNFKLEQFYYESSDQDKPSDQDIQVLTYESEKNDPARYPSMADTRKRNLRSSPSDSELLAQAVEDGESFNPSLIAKRTSKQPSPGTFADQLQVKNIRIKGKGLSASLASGAIVSLALKGSGIKLGVTVALEKGFGAALLTGSIVALPIVAMITTFGIIQHNKDKKIKHKLKKHILETEHEIQYISSKIQTSLDTLINDFNNDKIDLEALRKEINATNAKLNKVNINIQKRSHYDYKHGQYQRIHYYGQNSSVLMQAKIDNINLIKDQELLDQISKKVKQQSKDPLREQISRLKTLTNYPILTKEQLFELNLLANSIKEHHKYIKSLDDLASLNELIGIRLGVYIELSAVAPPLLPEKKCFKKSKDWSSADFQEATKQTIKIIAKEYELLKEAVQTKSPMAINEDLNRFLSRLDQIQNKLSQIKLVDGDKSFRSCSDYFDNYFETLRNNTTNALIQSNAAQHDRKLVFQEADVHKMKHNASLPLLHQLDQLLDSGNLTEAHNLANEIIKQNPSIDTVTKCELYIKEINYIQSCQIFNGHLATYSDSLKMLDDPTINEKEKDHAFKQAAVAGRAIIAINIEELNLSSEIIIDEGQSPYASIKNNINSFLTIYDNVGGTYSILEDIRKIQSILEDKQLLLKNENIKNLYEVSIKTKESLKNKKISNKTLLDLCNHAICISYKANYYEIREPLASAAVAILSNHTERFGTKNLQRLASTISSIHALFPTLTPDLLYLPYAIQKKEINSWAANFKQNLDSRAEEIFTFDQKHSFDNAVLLATQIDHLLKAFTNIHKKFPFTQNVAPILNKLKTGMTTYKAIKSWSDAEKFTEYHSFLIDNGIEVLFNLYELFNIRTVLPKELNQQTWIDRFKFRFQQRFVTKVRDGIETPWYYFSKDMLKLTALLAMPTTQLMCGARLLQGALTAYNAYSNQYVEQAIVAMMTNATHYINEKSTTKVNEILFKLEFTIYKEYHTLNYKNSDSKVVNQARLFVHDYKFSEMSRNGDFVNIRERSEITNKGGVTVFKYTLFPVDLHVNLIFLHIASKVYDGKYFIENSDQIYDDLNFFFNHIISSNHYSLDDKEQLKKSFINLTEDILKAHINYIQILGREPALFDLIKFQKLVSSLKNCKLSFIEDINEKFPKDSVYLLNLADEFIQDSQERIKSSINRFFKLIKDTSITETKRVNRAIVLIKPLARSLILTEVLNSYHDSGETLVSKAVLNDCYSLLEIFLRIGSNPNLSTADGSTPLSIAAYNNLYQCCKLLLNYQANPDLPNKSNGTTPLIFAAQEGHIDIVKLLLQAKANPNLACSQDPKCTPLSVAEQWKQEDITNLLSKYKPNRQTNTQTRLTDSSSSFFKAPIKSAKEDDLRIIESIVESITTRKNSSSELFVKYKRLQDAVTNGNINTVKSIILENPTIYSEEDQQPTMLWLAARNGHVEIIDFLLKHINKVEQFKVEYSSLILLEIQKSKATQEFVDRFYHKKLKMPFDPTFKYVKNFLRQSKSILLAAVESGNESMVIYILNNKLKLNIDPNKGFSAHRDAYHHYFSPLYAACERGLPKIVKAILEDANKKESPFVNPDTGYDFRDDEFEESKSPFGIAKEKGFKDILQLFVEYGFANKDALEDERGQSCLIM